MNSVNSMCDLLLIQSLIGQEKEVQENRLLEWNILKGWETIKHQRNTLSYSSTSLRVALRVEEGDEDKDKRDIASHIDKALEELRDLHAIRRMLDPQGAASDTENESPGRPSITALLSDDPTSASSSRRRKRRQSASNRQQSSDFDETEARVDLVKVLFLRHRLMCQDGIRVFSKTRCTAPTYLVHGG
jgi:hypothetical protein